MLSEPSLFRKATYSGAISGTRPFGRWASAMSPVIFS